MSIRKQLAQKVVKAVLKGAAGTALGGVFKGGRAMPGPVYWPIYAYERARGLGFTVESLFLNGLGLVMDSPIPKASAKLTAEVRRRYLELLQEDARQIQEGIFPLSVLQPESPREHFARLPVILWEGLKISRRRARGETARFSPAAEPYLKRVPRYFRRNFHFQSDGYLSARSAALYDHQVEVLFGGTADAMRRLCLKPLKEFFATLPAETGRPPEILEIACGNGSTTRFLAQTFPETSILATDLSLPYLRVAQERLKEELHVQFLQAPGEALPFRDAQFDAVVSVFLFHELPQEVRTQVVREAVRVLKPGGLVVFVDSAQRGDLPDFAELWDLFPAAFHEPFYRNYQEHPLEDLLRAEGLGDLKVTLGFLSKCLSARKSVKQGGDAA